MKISLSWIQDFVDLPKLSAEKIGDSITRHTAEVEEVEDLEKAYEDMIVGKVLSTNKHPNADRLTIAQVDIGKEIPVQIVCGGQNLKPNMLVAVAIPGAKVKWHGEGDLVTLEEARIRGELSFGMICAGEEIGLATDNPEGATEVHICDLSHLKVKPGTSLAKALGYEGAVLTIDNKSLTHRPDLWSHYGFAREISAIYEKPLKKLDEFLRHKTYTGKKTVDIKIEDNALCPRFSACIMSGIKVEESPEWLKSRLRLAGMNPHNNIVDITNYVMLELGQPMHAYDREVVGSDALGIRYAKKNEKLLTLEGTEHVLSSEDPIICNQKNEPLGIAGVKGGMKSGITGTTTEIILESANFDPVAVRKSAMRNDLRTDASQRFEKSLDPLLTETAIHRAINLIQTICPSAKLESKVTTMGTWKEKSLTIVVSPEKICSKIGLNIPEKEMTRILKALEFDVKKIGKNLTLKVPSHRATRDVSMEEDIVEEIARINGYDKIPAILPSQPIRLPIENEERNFKHTSRNILANSLGFTEVMTYSFYGKDRFEKCGIVEKDHIKILNYLSLDQTHMRISLTPNLLAVIAENCRQMEEIKIFEFGRTYREVGTFMPLEEKRLTAIIAKKGETFYEAKGALETFFKVFRVNNYELKPTKDPLSYAHPNKSLDILIDGEIIGAIFTVHPAVTESFDIALEVGLFTVNFTKLVKFGRKLQKFTPLPKFPGMEFDVSVLVDKKTTVQSVETAIKDADKDGLLKTIKLFDVYSGKNIPDDKKSLSFRIGMMHADRTLTDAEFQKLKSAVFLALESTGGKIRGS